MLCPYIRSSSYGAYDYCALKYFFSYNLGWNEPPNLKAQLGTIVHKVMECLAACKKRLQYGEHATMSIDDEHIGKVSFTKKSLYTKKFVVEILDRSFEHYSQSDKTNNYSSKEYKTCEEWTFKALNYNNGQFDPRNRDIIAPEQEFDLPIMEDWAIFEGGRLAIKGTIDLITEIENNTIEVVDWKTGARKNWATGEEKTYEKLQDDAQLLLYHYAISRIFPQYDHIIMTIFFIRDGGPFSMCFDKSDNDKFLDKLRKRYSEILKDVQPKPVDPTRRNFKCQKLCHFYKSNWPDTDQNMCEYVDNHLKVYGLEETIKNCKNPKFNVNHYKAPGAAE